METTSEDKKPRIFRISDETYKILCHADRNNFDPSIGLEKLVSIFISLNGPVDFQKLDLLRAQKKLTQLETLQDKLQEELNYE